MTYPLRDRLASPKADPLRWMGILAALTVAAFFCTERGRAALASTLPGVLESLGAGYLDERLGSGFGTIVPYFVLLAMLAVRPHGLLGRPRIERV